MPDHTGKRLEGTITMKDFRLNQMLMITALMLALAAMLAGPASARSFDDKASLYMDKAAASQTVNPYVGSTGTETAYRNNGWYTGLEYSDLPQPVQSDDGFQWGGVQIGAGAALAALLLATMTTIGLRTKGGRPATS
jgi:hypothetical protein